MTAETRRFRGISERLALRYLENLGGERRGDPEERRDDDEGPADDSTAHVEGDGWSATVSAERVEAAGSIRLTEVTVTFEGEASTLGAIIERFERKAIRAGG